MNGVSLCANETLEATLDQYGDMILRLAFSCLKNREDAEDVLQDVFVKLIEHHPRFESGEHEKAWLIRVTINACKDLLKSFWKHTIALDEIIEQPSNISPDHKEVLEAVLSLPARYRDVVYLHFYEGYTAPEISQILHKNVNTVYTLLNRSKQMLQKKLAGDRYE